MGDTEGGMGPVSDETIVALAESAEVHRKLLIGHTVFAGFSSSICGNCRGNVLDFKTCERCGVAFVFLCNTVRMGDESLESMAAHFGNVFRDTDLIFIGYGDEDGIFEPYFPEQQR